MNGKQNATDSNDENQRDVCVIRRVSNNLAAGNRVARFHDFIKFDRG